MLIKIKRGRWLFPRLYNTNGDYRRGGSRHHPWPGGRSPSRRTPPLAPVAARPPTLPPPARPAVPPRQHRVLPPQSLCCVACACKNATSCPNFGTLVLSRVQAKVKSCTERVEEGGMWRPENSIIKCMSFSSAIQYQSTKVPKYHLSHFSLFFRFDIKTTLNHI